MTGKTLDEHAPEAAVTALPWWETSVRQVRRQRRRGCWLVDTFGCGRVWLYVRGVWVVSCVMAERLGRGRWRTTYRPVEPSERRRDHPPRVQLATDDLPF